MMQSNVHPLVPLSLIVAAGSLLLQTGCSVLKPKADTTRFYVLRAHATQSTASSSSVNSLPEIRVGPGGIAGYLNATPIALQQGPRQLQFLDRHHWAEPLMQGINRVLAETLEAALNTGYVTVYPNPLREEVGFEVQYMVNRFEGELNGPITLDVSWQIVHHPSKDVIIREHSVYRIPNDDGQHEVDAYVNRMSLGVAEWAADLEKSLEKRMRP